MEEVRLVKVVNNANGTFYYRPALSTETEVVDRNEFEVEGGIIRFQGFDPGDYYFHETKAPEGYNILTTDAHFTLSDLNKDAIFNSGIYSSGSGFHITNQSGTMLPETGGLGTLLFTVLGGGAALSTGVVLVTKKRMSKIEDEE
jgi:LPXTG-motif cell wall-anchored protein